MSVLNTAHKMAFGESLDVTGAWADNSNHLQREGDMDSDNKESEKIKKAVIQAFTDPNLVFETQVIQDAIFDYDSKQKDKVLKLIDRISYALKDELKSFIDNLMPILNESLHTQE